MYSALIKYIESHTHTPFEWGVHDCCTFTAGAYQVVYGVNLLDQIDGEYNNLETARATLKANGPASLLETIKTMFNEVHISQACRGDLVYKLDKEHGAALGICMGSYSVFAGDFGVVQHLTNDCIKGFKWVAQ